MPKRPDISNGSKAFTLVEMLVVLALSLILLVVTITTFSGLSNTQSVDKDAENAVALLQKARNYTVNSENALSYGVAFASTSVTFFKGTTYSPTASTNITYKLSTKVLMSSLQLTGGATSIYFKSISGEPSATGTISYQLSKVGSTTRTIILYGTGMAEVE